MELFENRLTLTPELRRMLKRPLGTLFKGEAVEAVKAVKEAFLKSNPVKVAAVGDVVSEALSKAGVKVDLYVTDSRVMRRRFSDLKLEAGEVYRVENPPGTINPAAAEAIFKALKSTTTVRIMVEGEEDLLTLPAILAAPIGSAVIYGQPGEGMVLIKVTAPIKEDVRRIVKAMQRV